MTATSRCRRRRALRTAARYASIAGQAALILLALAAAGTMLWAAIVEQMAGLR